MGLQVPGAKLSEGKVRQGREAQRQAVEAGGCDRRPGGQSLHAWESRGGEQVATEKSGVALSCDIWRGCRS